MEFANLRKKWAISLKPEYVEAFRNGTKKYEVRSKEPISLCPHDSIYVVQSGSGGKVVLRLEVGRILQFSPDTAWRCYSNELGISKEDFDDYTKGREKIALLRIDRVENMPENMTIKDLGLNKAPQWFQQIKK